jgi:DNA-directed RNA polymerase specialized sigma24 family protein
LLDADRILLRTFALIARHALRYRGKPDVDAWIRSLADEAIASILREDAEADRRGLTEKSTASTARSTDASSDAESAREHGSAFAALARPLGLEPRAMGRACLAFNRLPPAERRAFHALVIAGRTLDDVAREWGEGATDIARRARRALDAILVGAAAGGGSQGAPARPVAAAEPRGGGSRASKDAGNPSSQADDTDRKAKRS